MTSWNIKWRERIKLLETWATASKKKTWGWKNTKSSKYEKPKLERDKY
jgi:hypothetical protein